MVASEAVPLAKTGGLADVLGALPPALRALGDQVAVVMPLYGSVESKGMRRVYDRLPIYLGLARHEISIYLTRDEAVYLVDCPALYDRKSLYGEAGQDYPDNHIRFAVLARAALAVARFLFKTDIFHCHDWQAGLLPAYLRTTFALDPSFLGTKTLFTIHNLGYQGIFPESALEDVALDRSLFHPEGVEFFGKLSLLKSGIALADALTTVSPSYAGEIQTPEFGFGMDGVLRARSEVLSGILNGVDYREWNPETDLYLPARYSARDLSGKCVCKEQLLSEMGLPAGAAERPLLAMVSRLAQQKGIDLAASIADDLVREDLYLVAQGTGDPEQEELLTKMATTHPDRIAVRLTFDNGLAHRIEAGADIFLMPSRYEPSGLNQMYSLRYGTVPVVRAAGGLNDTIDEGTGFKFADETGQALLAAIREAARAYSQPETWKAMMLRGMEKDFSWNRSAGAYSALYRRLLGKR